MLLLLTVKCYYCLWIIERISGQLKGLDQKTSEISESCEVLYGFKIKSAFHVTTVANTGVMCDLCHLLVKSLVAALWTDWSHDSEEGCKQ